MERVGDSESTPVDADTGKINPEPYSGKTACFGSCLSIEIAVKPCLRPEERVGDFFCTFCPSETAAIQTKLETSCPSI